MPNQLMQFVTQEFCLKCDTCCRFLDSRSEWMPIFTAGEIADIRNKRYPPCVFTEENKIKLIPYKDTHICPFFSYQDNKCLIYSIRPFDCQLYPFILTYQDNNELFLGVDKKCPFIRDKIETEDFKKYTRYLADFLLSRETAKFISDNPNLISQLKDDVLLISPLDILSKAK